MNNSPTNVLVAKSDFLSSAVVHSQCRGVSYVTIVFKATLEIVPNGVARPLQPEPVIGWDVPRSQDARASLAFASEIAPFLSRAAVLVSAIAHPPPAPTPQPFLVRLLVHTDRATLIDKHLQVFSPNGGPIALTYEDAFGTPENPSGTMHPRITDPRNPKEAGGFGPLHPGRASRAEILAGTPPPFMNARASLELGNGVDARYFNAAPTDQQIGFLQGTETIILEGLDPEHRRLATSLGGVTIMAHAAQTGGTFTSLQPVFDTLVIDAPRRRISALWRVTMPLPQGPALQIQGSLRWGRDQPQGAPAIPAPRASDLGKTRTAEGPIYTAAALPFNHPQSAPASVRGGVVVDPEAKKRLERTLDAVSVPGRALPFNPVASAPRSPSDDRAPRAPVVTPAQPPWIPALGHHDTIDQIIVPPSSGAPLLPASVRGLGLGEMRLGVKPPDGVIPQQPSPAAPATFPAPPPQQPPLVQQPSQVEPQLIVIGAPQEPAPPQLAPQQQTPPQQQAEPEQPPALDDRGDPRRRAVLQRLAENGALRDMDLQQADLTDLDLAGRAFSGSNLEGAKLARSILRGANLAGVNLAHANLEATKLDEADLSNARLGSVNLQGASLDQANLTRADLSGALASRASFVEIRGEASRFGGADLQNASFARASLRESDFSKALLGRASFVDADLERANFAQIEAEGADFSGARITQASFPKAALTKAKLDRASAEGASFERASLVGTHLADAKLKGANFEKSSLDEACFDRADLTDASFIQCVGPDAQFRDASAERAIFKQARLDSATFTNAKLRGANLQKADLSRSSMEGADLSAVDARGAKLVSAKLTGAKLNEADFRDADLSGAHLEGTSQVDTKLKGAKLPK